VVGGVLENGPHDEPLHISNYVCESSVIVFVVKALPS
jgi:hypothetical protein